jgi:hypothetical protein
MPDHEFVLILGPGVEVDDATADKLFEAGCDDGTFGSRGGVAYVDFTREAPTFRGAVLSAIADVRKAGLPVVRVEPDDLVSVAEIARRIGQTRESVRLYSTGERGPGGFPRPVSGTTRRSPMYRWSDIAGWLESLPEAREGRPEGKKTRHVAIDADVLVDALSSAKAIGAINAALDLRRLAGTDEAAELLQAVGGRG